MLCGYAFDSDTFVVHATLPPVHVTAPGNFLVIEIAGIAETGKNLGLPPAGNKTQSRQVHVIIMIMRKENDIDRWKIPQAHSRSLISFWTNKTHRTGAIRPDGVGDNIYSLGLH